MKRITGIAAVLIAAVMLLSSCGIVIINKSPGTSAQETDVPSDTRGGGGTDTDEIIIDMDSSYALRAAADEALASLDTVKLGGARVLIAAVNETFLVGDGSESALTTDRAARISKISEKLDADVAVRRYTEEELYLNLQQSVKNGEYFADVIAVPQSLVGKLVSDGLVMSFRTVPYFDASDAVFYKDGTAAFTAGHGIYAVCGDLCFEPEALYGIYFNKSAAKKLGLDLYSEMYNGNWTLKKYAECVKAANDAGMTGAALREGGYMQMLLHGSGFELVRCETDELPYVNTFGDEFAELVSDLSAIPNVTPAEDAGDRFLNGDVLFYIDTVHSAAERSDSGLEWGLLPFPKYDRADSYSSCVGDDKTVLCIPAGVSDERTSGDIIKALAYSSEGFIKYDYLYHNMLNVLRDNGSVNSLDHIMNGENYEFVSAFESGYPTLYANTEKAVLSLISGELTFEEYKEREPDVREYVEKWFPVKNR